MTTRNLDALFAPRCIALFGASEREGSLGKALLENLRDSFDGTLLPVNPKYRRLGELRCWKRVRDLPEVPDLAVIATPPATVPGLIEKLARRGTRAACVVTTGLDKPGAPGYQQLLDAAQPGLLRIVGPNSIGLQVPAHGLNASFAHLAPEPGSLAFVTQSGAMIASVLDWACPRGIGFSHTISLGDMVDVDFGDMLDYLASDAATKAILLYIESITHARKFISAARAAASSKPVIVVKGGRYRAGAQAVTAHIGAQAGNDAVYDAAFRRAGMLRVFTLEGLFDAVETLSRARPPDGDRLLVLTNGGGIGVLACDALAAAGGELAVLSQDTIARLDDVLPPEWSRGNPVDIVGDADGERYRHALDALLADEQNDAILVMNCPTALAQPEECAQAVIDVLREHPGHSVLCNWIGSYSATAARQALRRHGLPVYESPDDAIAAFAQMTDYRRNQALLLETPPSLPTLFEPNRRAAESAIHVALDRGQSVLDITQTQAVLQAYGIVAMPAQRAATPADAARIAGGLGASVALKIDAPDMVSKSDCDGVVLNVAPERVETAARRLVERVNASHPDTLIAGLTVQAMVHRPGARELCVGMFTDAQFGPVLSLCPGGTAMAPAAQRALALPPLNLKLAGDLIGRAQLSRLLAGVRDVPPADRDALALLLVQLSHLVVDCPQVQALQLDPLLVDARGVVVLDARIEVGEAFADGAARLAIRPYPKELEETITTRDGRQLLLRPIVPEDKSALQASFNRLTPEQVRFRFFSPMKLLSDHSATRFSHIDYDRQMALVLSEPGVPGRSDVYGVVRIFESPGREFAEFAIVLVDEVAGMGMGTLMMTRIIDYAVCRGIGELRGDVLSDNGRMLALARKLGFVLSTDPQAGGVIRATLALRGAGQTPAASRRDPA